MAGGRRGTGTEQWARSPSQTKVAERRESSDAPQAESPHPERSIVLANLLFAVDGFLVFP
jgi:hypothetical protein